MSTSRLPPDPRTAAGDAQLLRQRRQALARVPEQAVDAADVLELVEFRLAEERYALETRHVQEVHPLRDLTPLPCTPVFVLGLINLRSQLLPVIDIRKLLELPERGITDLHRVLVLRSGDTEFGLLADTVEEVFTLPRSALQRSLPTLHGIRADYLLGVTAESLVVLDGARLLADPRIVVDEEVEI